MACKGEQDEAAARDYAVLVDSVVDLMLRDDKRAAMGLLSRYVDKAREEATREAWLAGWETGAAHWRDSAKAEERAGKLEQIVRDLLASADSSWEEHRGGHDWADTVERARRALIPPPPPSALIPAPSPAPLAPPCLCPDWCDAHIAEEPKA